VSSDQPSLREAVAGELAAASSRLSDAEQEALARRERQRLPHGQIAQELGLESERQAALLLAGARLRLRAELRGGSPESPGGCAARERALILLAKRQDGESLEPDEEDWIRQHMAECEPCERAHAAMLEASVCYRAWEP
jgi:hypothetical protein